MDDETINKIKHTMKRLALLLVAMFAFTAIATADNKGKGTLTEHTFKHKGVEYTYWLYKPQNLPEGAPLIMAFHGYGSRNIPSVGYGFHPVADEHGFAVCYPKGPEDNKGKHCWAVGYDFHLTAGWERDDVGFAVRLVKHLQKKHGFSKHNVFATGHSNGGEMSYLLAYKASDTFAAVAPISGLTMEWMYRTLSGLYTYEDFKEYVPKVLFDAYQGQYLKVSIGKGHTTFEEILQLIDIYINDEKLPDDFVNMFPK